MAMPQRPRTAESLEPDPVRVLLERYQTERRPPADALAEREFVEGVLRAEAGAIAALADTLDARFHEAVGLLVRCADEHGTVLVTGLGKSGLIGAKISATLTSLGITSHSVHPAEAAHGDLGRFRKTDTVIALSHSGETDEVVNLAAVLHQDGLPIIAITKGSASAPDRRSTLERLAAVTLAIGVEEEAGAADFAAPTSSTAAMLAIGDALALAAARRRGFTIEEFARRHPGGSLGGLVRSVKDILRFKGANCPLVPQSLSVREGLDRLEVGRRPGAILVVDESGRLAGILTDGDLRRLVLRDPDWHHRPLSEVMTKDPQTLHANAPVMDAVKLVRERRLDEIPVVHGDHWPLGILDVQDLVAMRLVRD